MMNERKMVTILEDREPTLEEAQKLVGGYVELVEMPNGEQVLCNEEGLLLSFPANIEALDLTGRVFVGPVVILRHDARWH